MPGQQWRWRTVLASAVVGVAAYVAMTLSRRTMAKEVPREETKAEKVQRLNESAKQQWKEEQYETAADTYACLMEVEPDCAKTYLNLARCHLRLRELEKSIGYALVALEFDHEETLYKDCTWIIGRAYLQLSEFDRAATAFRTLLARTDLSPALRSMVQKNLAFSESQRMLVPLTAVNTAKVAKESAMEELRRSAPVIEAEGTAQSSSVLSEERKEVTLLEKVRLILLDMEQDSDTVQSGRTEEERENQVILDVVAQEPYLGANAQTKLFSVLRKQLDECKELLQKQAQSAHPTDSTPVKSLETLQMGPNVSNTEQLQHSNHQ